MDDQYSRYLPFFLLPIPPDLSYLEDSVIKGLGKVLSFQRSKCLNKVFFPCLLLARVLAEISHAEIPA